MSAVANFARAKLVLANSAEVGVPESRLPFLAILKTARAAGVIHVLSGANSVIGVDDTGVNEDSQERFFGGLFAGYGAAWLWPANRNQSHRRSCDSSRRPDRNVSRRPTE